MTKFSVPKSLTACALMGFIFIPVAQAQEKNPAASRIDIRSQAVLQYITEDDRDLNISGDNADSSFSQQLQTSIKAGLSENTTMFVSGRALNISGEAGFDDDTEESNSLDQTFLELREFWVMWDHFGIDPLNLQVGRQRVKEPRALWWNTDFDMARLNYHTTLLNGFIGAGEELASYRTKNTDFLGDDEERFRVLGELSWQYKYDHFLEGRFLYENDHSGTEAIGSVIGNDDRDDEDNNDVVWTGLRTAGTFANPSTALKNFKYRADVIGLFGEEDTVTSAAGPGVNQRTITGVGHQDVRAWAFDSGFSVAPDFMGSPVFTAGYSYGSGDGNAGDGTNHEFRQTDLEGSSSRIGLERQQQKNFGEVLRPELSNLHILTAGVGVPLTKGTDIGATYFNYHLANNATALRSSGISAPLNGTDKEVGQAADFILNVDVDEELNMQSRYVDDVGFRVVLGTFFPGDAYTPNSDEDAYRVFTELRVRF